MKLLQVHRDVIRCISHRATLSVHELGTLLPYKAHVIRRSLDQLLEKKVIKKSVMCNFYRLGYTPHNLHFSLATRDPKKKKAILDHIIRHPQISWCGGITGELPYEVTFLARDLSEIGNFFDQLSDRHGPIFEKKKIGSEMCHNYFGPKYISSTPIPIPTLTLEEPSEKIELDHVDCTLMYYLCFDGDIRLADMAKKLGLGISTLTYRKKRLCDIGVLLSEVYFVDRDRFVPINFNVMLSTTVSDSRFREALATFCKNDPHFFCCHRCIGNWDYKINIQGEELASTTAAIERLKDTFGENIASLDVVTVVRHYKDAFFPFYKELQQVTKVPALERNIVPFGEVRRA